MGIVILRGRVRCMAMFEGGASIQETVAGSSHHQQSSSHLRLLPHNRPQLKAKINVGFLWRSWHVRPYSAMCGRTPHVVKTKPYRILLLLILDYEAW